MAKEIKSEQDKTSYALGINLGQSVAQLPVKLDAELVAQGVKDILSGAQPALSQEEYVKTMKAFQAQMQQMEQEAQEAGKKVAEANVAEAKKFLAENKDAEGVITTDSGLQYVVLKEGDGPQPGAEDTVEVHYTGTLLDGTVFDSSVERGQSIEFGVGQVIKGWTEALQLMKVGSKYKLFIPAELAYGERGAGNVIKPGAMLIFEVELLGIK